MFGVPSPYGCVWKWAPTPKMAILMGNVPFEQYQPWDLGLPHSKNKTNQCVSYSVFIYSIHISISHSTPILFLLLLDIISIHGVTHGHHLEKRSFPFFPHLFQQFIGRARQLRVLWAQQGAEVPQGEGVEEEHLPALSPGAPVAGARWPRCMLGVPWSAAEAVSVGPRAPRPQICR